MGNQSNTTEVRRLSACSFDEAVKIWNEGFRLLRRHDAVTGWLPFRLTRDGLSPEFSLVALWTAGPRDFCSTVSEKALEAR